ncbi:hypothetical protein H4219_005718 [Mycoemilia scoparia]|uniref:Uncharacterized protein n=1 Tax=Mycoemilia scoparia TaxID=417184 RepID=A0A9W7ZUZ6_9FUNG|nr:hypothetical protein H4219_005718 [Mycoemilia scoparia]
MAPPPTTTDLLSGDTNMSGDQPSQGLSSPLPHTNQQGQGQNRDFNQYGYGYGPGVGGGGGPAPQGVNSSMPPTQPAAMNSYAPQVPPQQYQQQPQQQARPQQPQPQQQQQPQQPQAQQQQPRPEASFGPSPSTYNSRPQMSQPNNGGNGFSSGPEKYNSTSNANNGYGAGYGQTRPNNYQQQQQQQRPQMNRPSTFPSSNSYNNNINNIGRPPQPYNPQPSKYQSNNHNSNNNGSSGSSKTALLGLVALAPIAYGIFKSMNKNKHNNNQSSNYHSGYNNGYGGGPNGRPGGSNGNSSSLSGFFDGIDLKSIIQTVGPLVATVIGSKAFGSDSNSHNNGGGGGHYGGGHGGLFTPENMGGLLNAFTGNHHGGGFNRNHGYGPNHNMYSGGYNSTNSPYGGNSGYNSPFYPGGDYSGPGGGIFPFGYGGGPINEYQTNRGEAFLSRVFNRLFRRDENHHGAPLYTRDVSGGNGSQSPSSSGSVDLIESGRVSGSRTRDAQIWFNDYHRDKMSVNAQSSKVLGGIAAVKALLVRQTPEEQHVLTMSREEVMSRAIVQGLLIYKEFKALYANNPNVKIASSVSICSESMKTAWNIIKEASQIQGGHQQPAGSGNRHGNSNSSNSMPNIGGPSIHNNPLSPPPPYQSNPNIVHPTY